jgi:hypothetical protein
VVLGGTRQTLAEVHMSTTTNDCDVDHTTTNEGPHTTPDQQKQGQEDGQDVAGSVADG